MLIQVVIPTIPGREQLLGEALASFEERGFDPVVVAKSPSWGEGWAIGLEACRADYVLLGSDDIELAGISRLDTALARAAAGLVVSPVILNADGSLQGAGGFGQRLEDGALARTTIFPFASRTTFLGISPWPATTHYCDSWISECAWRLGRGPIVTHGFDIVHKIISPIREGEVQAYDSWRAERLRALPTAARRGQRELDTIFRSHEGRSIVVTGIRARSRTELRLLSADGRGYVASTPWRVVGASRRTLRVARAELDVRARTRGDTAHLATARWRAAGVVRGAVGVARARLAVRSRVRERLTRRASESHRD